jgi:broad specificity phosphatase PhoE
MRLYWVRYGESDANLIKEFSCRLSDRPLTPKGVLQAQQTAEFFAGKEIAAIYCSPLQRTLEPAQVIGYSLKMSAVPLEFFREIDNGDLEKCPPTMVANRLRTGTARKLIVANRMAVG